MGTIGFLILVYTSVAAPLVTAETWRRWGSFLLTGLLVLTGIIFLIYVYYRFGEYDLAWYTAFMILAAIPLIPVSIFSTLVGRWFYSRYHKQKQG